jgi:hypothetical protein
LFTLTSTLAEPDGDFASTLVELDGFCAGWLLCAAAPLTTPRIMSTPSTRANLFMAHLRHQKKATEVPRTFLESKLYKTHVGDPQ